ncbi:MAG: FAD-dependent oxidoreductase, partial [Demequinaceae bacterium]|nr:FAD-dependent oxidoreductase [Demequinaceae bacterium]
MVAETSAGAQGWGGTRDHWRCAQGGASALIEPRRRRGPHGVTGRNGAVISVGTTVFERQPTARDVIVAALKDTKLKPFWLDDATHVERRALAEDIEADLVIVGAGYTGLWAAVQAKERDPNRSVVIVEAHTVGWAASGRNGGFCEPSLTHGHDNGASRWPEEIDELERLGAQNIDEIEQTVKRYTMDVNFERNGSLTVAVEPHQVAELEGDVLSTEEIQALVKSPTYLAAQSDGRDTALVHPAKLAYEL